MSFVVWLDEDGNEIKREIKTRGRPPKGAVHKDDGNFYITGQPDADKGIYYVWMDEEGKVVRKEQKGRGRPKPGFEKAEDGNWYLAPKSPVVQEELL